MSPKKCIFGCEGKVHLFAFPKEQSTRHLWEQFVFSGQKPHAYVFVCSRHFTEDSFINKAQYDAGFSARLLLKDGAVPSIKGRIEESQAQAVCEAEPDGSGEEEADRVSHVVAEMCILTSLKWLEQQAEALPQHLHMLRELHALAVRKREMNVCVPLSSGAVHTGGNLSKSTLSELASRRSIGQEGEGLGGGGLDTASAAPAPSHMEKRIKMEAADGAEPASGMRLHPEGMGAETVSGEHVKAEQDSELADFDCAGSISDKLKCEPTEVSISGHTSTAECTWGET